MTDTPGRFTTMAKKKNGAGSLPVPLKKARRIFRKYRKFFSLLGALLAGVLALCYLLAFFESGAPFQGNTFLKKSSSGGDTVYSGKDADGDIVLTVHQRDKTETDISYLVPYNKLKTYTVSLTEVANKNPDLPSSYSLRITAGNGSILFDGSYQRGDSFLYSKAGLPLYGDDDSVREGVNPYSNYEPNLRRMVGFVTGEYDRRRGSWPQLLLGLLFLGLVWLLKKNPRLFHTVWNTVVGSDSLDQWRGAALLLVKAVAAAIGVGFLLAAI